MLRNDSQCLAKSSSPQTNEKAPSMTEVFSININNNSKLAGLTGGKFPPALCTSPQKSTFGLNEVLYNNCLDRWSSASDCSFFFFFFSSKYQQYSATELVRFSSFVAMHLSFIPKILVGSYNKNIEGNLVCSCNFSMDAICGYIWLLVCLKVWMRSKQDNGLAVLQHSKKLNWSISRA